MRPSRRASFVIAAIAGLASSLVLFPDPLIATALLVLVALVVFEGIWMVIVANRPERWFGVYDDKNREHAKIARTLFPGDMVQDTLYFTKRVGGTAVLQPTLSFLRLSPGAIRVQDEVTMVTAEFKTPFAGEYHSERIGFDAVSPLGLLTQHCSLQVNFDYSVYPRTLAVAGESAKIIGRGEIGDYSIDLPGVGTEFYEIRKYQPGDDFRRINWKSTAKYGDLMTNERTREVAAPCYLVLEAVSPSYFDKDRLAATFLGLANALAAYRIRFGVMVHDGEKVRQLTRVDHPVASLAVAFKEALSFVELDKTDLGEELSYLAGDSSSKAAKAFEGRGLSTLSELVEVGQAQRRVFAENQNVVQTITQLVEESAEDRPAVLYVSGLFTRLDALLEAAWNVSRIYGAKMIVADPAAPWIAAKGENEAYELNLLHQKRLEELRSAGVEYQVGEPAGVVQRVLSS